MNTNIIIAITINIGILLIASWVFGAYLIRSLTKEKQQLINELTKLRKGKPTSAPVTTGQKDSVDLYPTLEEMAQELREKEARINTLLNIQNNQTTTKELITDLENSDDDANNINEKLLAHLSLMEADYDEMETIIVQLQGELDDSRRALEKMEDNKDIGQAQSARIAALEKTERKMRDENKKLRASSQSAGVSEKRIQTLTKENQRLKRTVKSLANASNEQLEVIKKLHAEIDRASELGNHQKKLITDLEKRLNNEKDNDNDSEKVALMEQELENLQDTLKRTLIEKDFIEQHLIDMDDSLEKAKETEQALQRAQKEIKTLEQHFPDFEPSIPRENTAHQSEDTEAVEAPPIFTTEIKELNDIIEDNRLFGALQEFWSTLDAPPITLLSTQHIKKPKDLNDWVYITIGDSHYSLFLTLNSDLAKTVTEAIFKEESETNNDSKKQDATGELGNVVAGTIATELDNGFALSIPQHITQNEAKEKMQADILVAEMLASSQDQPVYIALTTPKES